MRQATVGSILINNLLPEDLRDYRRIWNKKETAKTLTQLAKRYPERYKEISHRLLQYGYDFAYRTGGQSFGLDDIHESKATGRYREQIQRDTQAILAKHYRQGRESDNPQVQKEIANMLASYYPKLTADAMAEKEQADSPFYRQAYGTGAQKPGTYNSIIGADLRYEDAHGKLVPIPVTRGYAKGLTPAEYIAGTYGGRKGIVDLQKATMSAGAFSKQLVQMTHREVVTADDNPNPYDESNPLGYPTDINDPDNEGAYLAHPVAGYKRNTLLTPEVIADIKKQGVQDILIRSVMVGGPADGGIYAYDAGVREKGTRPYIGDYVGISAVQALSEPLTQSAISSKHTGGVVGAASAKAISGFSYINQLVQVPKHFPNGATHATMDGRVTDITKAPQGGTYVWIDGVKHYVEPTRDGADNELKVKRGDFVEAGDAISSGIPNPATIVKYKGIGEGRRAFTNQFGSALRDAGISVHRRNIEALSRGLISYVKLTDELGDYSPEDVLPYAYVASHYRPRKDAQQGDPKKLKGMYLEKPVLHYTVGTRLQPSVIRELQKYKVTNVTAHKDPPPFEPEMIRAMAHVSKDPDWSTRMLGGYNKDSLLEAARTGSSSNLEGTSFVPALALGGDKFKPDQRRADMIPTLTVPRLNRVTQDGE